MAMVAVTAHGPPPPHRSTVFFRLLLFLLLNDLTIILGGPPWAVVTGRTANTDDEIRAMSSEDVSYMFDNASLVNVSLNSSLESNSTIAADDDASTIVMAIMSVVLGIMILVTVIGFAELSAMASKSCKVVSAALVGAIVLVIVLLIIGKNRGWFDKDTDENNNNLKIVPVGCSLNIGKGPIWDEETQTLFYVDIFPHTIHSYSPSTRIHNSVVVDTEDPLTQIARIEGEKNSFIIALKNHLAKVTWDGVSSDPLKPEFFLDVEDKNQTTRLNGGKCDPSNRIWTGTMGALINGTHDQYEQGKGSLYMINHDNSVIKQATNIGISNGMAWSVDKKYMYYIDSLTYKVDRFAYNDTSGSISDRTTIFSFKENSIDGLTDGMNIDQEGMLWITSFGGAKIVRVDPATGKMVRSIDIPSQQVCSVQFAGPGMNILYVATAKVGLSKEDEEKYPYSGYMFEITGLGIKGTPSVPVKL